MLLFLLLTREDGKRVQELQRPWESFSGLERDRRVCFSGRVLPKLQSRVTQLFFCNLTESDLKQDSPVG